MNPGARALLSVSEAHVAYGKVEAVRAVSLDVADNEIVTIIGANGAGKTTLLNAIMGILPLKGRASFAGVDMAQLDIEDRVAIGLSLVPEHRELFGTMNVEDNLQLGAFRIAKAVAAKSFERVYTLFPRLKERRRQLAGTLSGGEQQMLAMGRALMGAPRLLMLDEPSLGLAPIIVADIFRTIGELRAAGVLGAAGRTERPSRAKNRRPRLCDGARRIDPERTGGRGRDQPARGRKLSRLPARRRQRDLEFGLRSDRGALPSPLRGEEKRRAFTSSKWVLDKRESDCKTASPTDNPDKNGNGGNNEPRSSPAGVAGARHWTFGNAPRLCGGG